MSPEWLATLIVRELDAFERELALFPDEASVWRVPPGVANSAGTLALHVCGSLLHFVGAVLGASGYVRDRAREFSARDIPRASLVADIEAAREVVVRIVPALTEDDLTQPFPEEVAGMRIVTALFLMHLSVHLAFHLGQAGYVRRIVTQDERSSSPLPLKPLA